MTADIRDDNASRQGDAVMTAPAGPPRPGSRARHRPGLRPYPHPPAPDHSRIAAASRRAVATLLAGTALAALLVGFPVVLILAARWPLPRALPTWATVQAALTATTLTDQLLINTLACLGWLCWGLLTLSAVVEVAAAVRRVPVPRLPGISPAQALIGALIGAMALAPLMMRPATPGAEARTTITQADTDLGAGTGHIVLLVSGTAHSYPVRPGDTLWDIARVWLGDPHRWPEIYHLNAGRTFPDTGGTLRDPDLIYPGWELTLPDDAHPPGVRSARPAATGPTGPTAPPAPAEASTPAAPAASPTTPAPPAPSEEPAEPVPATPPSAQVLTLEPQSPDPADTSDTSPTTASGAPQTTPPPTAASSHRPHQDPSSVGVTVPGGWIGLPFAAALTAAATLSWRRRRRHYRADEALDASGAAEQDDDDFAPLPSVLAATRRELRRRAPDLLRPPVDDVTVAQAAEAHRDGRPAPAPAPSGPDGLALAGLPVPRADVLSLDGPGASSAARAMLVATLVSGGPQDGDAQGHIVTTEETWQALFHAPETGDTADRFDSAAPLGSIPRLAILPDLTAALTHLEEQLVGRRRLLLLDAVPDTVDLAEHGRDPHHEPLPRIVLLTTSPSALDLEDRLRAGATLGSDLNITVVVVGTCARARHLFVDSDGQITGPTSDAAPDEDPGTEGRAATLDATSARDALRSLAAPGHVSPSATTVDSSNGAEEPAQPPDPAPSRADAQPPETPPARPQVAAATQPTPPPTTDPPAPEPTIAAGATRVSIRILGTPTVLLPDGTPVDSLREAARELLTYLAVHRQGATLDEVKEALYGDATRERARQRLSTDVANLRGRIRHCLGAGATGPNPIVNTGGRYHLDPLLVDIDWWHVQDATADAKTATTRAAQLDALERARQAFRGPIADDRDYEWVGRPREHSRHFGVGIHINIATLIADTDPTRAAELLEAACDLDPYNEDLARRALRAHAKLGNTDAVRTRLRRLRTALDELDESPDDQSEDLARKLLGSRRSAPVAPQAPTTREPLGRA